MANSKVSDFMALHNIPQATDAPATPPPSADAAVIQEDEPKKDDGWKHEQAAMQAIEELRQSSSNPHVEKMITTILALIDARLAGSSETAVFGQPDTCNVSTYHKKWKHDEHFAKCLDALTKLAIEWKDTRHVRAIRTAAERIQLASPIAATTLVRLMSSHDQNIQLRAANSILDRADSDTANKEAAVIQQILNYVNFSLLSPTQIEALQTARNLPDVIEALVQQ